MFAKDHPILNIDLAKFEVRAVTQVYEVGERNEKRKGHGFFIDEDKAHARCHLLAGPQNSSVRSPFREKRYCALVAKEGLDCWLLVDGDLTGPYKVPISDPATPTSILSPAV